MLFTVYVSCNSKQAEKFQVAKANIEKKFYELFGKGDFEVSVVGMYEHAESKMYMLRESDCVVRLNERVDSLESAMVKKYDKTTMSEHEMLMALSSLTSFTEKLGKTVRYALRKNA